MLEKKPYRRPDGHSPRFRRDCKRMLNKDFYKKYYKQFPESKLSKQDIRKIIHTFHELCTQTIAETRDGLELPEQLGYLFVGSCKKKEAPINERKSWDYKMEVKQMNWESNNWLCKLCYTNFANKYRFKNASLWAFETSKPFKKKISVAYRKNYKQYLILDNFIKLNHIFWRHRQEERQKLLNLKNDL